MDEKERNMISDPDENGVRYYSIEGLRESMPPLSAPSGDGGDTGESANQGGPENLGEAREPSNSGGGPGTPGGPGGPGIPGGFGPRKGSKKKPIIIFACILLAVVLLGVACSRMDSNEDSRYADLSDDHISVLYITGTISGDESSSLTGSDSYNHQWVLNRLNDAIYNTNNKGLILYVDSPGGGVYETDEIYMKLMKYKETGRPIYSAMGSMAASGGYYISAPAEKIFANRNCWTGSIGVIVGTFYDISELMDRYGIKAQNITSGKNKAMGSMTEPMTKEQKAIYQSLVDEAYEQFVGIVAEGRNMELSKVKKLADGRIYTAKQAVENGLIDQIGTLEDAIADMRSSYGLTDCSISEMKYKNDSFWGSIFSNLSKLQGSGSKGDVAALLEMMEAQGKVPISYMSEIQK